MSDPPLSGIDFKNKMAWVLSPDSGLSLNLLLQTVTYSMLWKRISKSIPIEIPLKPFPSRHFYKKTRKLPIGNEILLVYDGMIEK